MAAKWETHTYRPAWRSFYKHIFAMLLIFIIAAVVSFKVSMEAKSQIILWLIVLLAMLLIFLDMAIKRIGSYLVVRREEVAFETGILKRNSTEMGFEDIRTVNVDQSLMQRIFNLGTVSIASSGTGEYEIRVKGLPSPSAIRDEIQERKRTAAPKPADEEPAPEA